MGAAMSSIDALVHFGQPKRKRKILLVGLDCAGKTTMLYKMQLGKVETTIPTIGLNVETVQYQKGVAITTLIAWDVGGRDPLRPLWRHYYQNTDGIIFMVDSNDRERVEWTAEKLSEMLKEEELMDKPLLVFANKQDLPNALRTSELVEKLNLHSIRNRKWFIQECVATQGKGLYEGLGWLVAEMQSSAKEAQPSVDLPAKASRAKALAEQADDISTADTEDATARAEIIKTHP